MKFATLAPTGGLYNIRTGGEIVKFLSPGIRFKPHFKGVWGFSSALPQGLKAGALHGESPTPPPHRYCGKNRFYAHRAKSSTQIAWIF
jgi:hypothetical protein